MSFIAGAKGDRRYEAKEAALMAALPSHPLLEQPLACERVNFASFHAHWMERVEAILEYEDELLVDYCLNLWQDAQRDSQQSNAPMQPADMRSIQMALSGFMGPEAALEFVVETAKWVQEADREADGIPAAWREAFLRQQLKQEAEAKRLRPNPRPIEQHLGRRSRRYFDNNRDLSDTDFSSEGEEKTVRRNSTRSRSPRSRDTRSPRRRSPGPAQSPKRTDPVWSERRRSRSPRRRSPSRRSPSPRRRSPNPRRRSPRRRSPSPRRRSPAKSRSPVRQRMSDYYRRSPARNHPHHPSPSPPERDRYRRSRSPPSYHRGDRSPIMPKKSPIRPSVPSGERRAIDPAVLADLDRLLNEARY